MLRFFIFFALVFSFMDLRLPGFAADFPLKMQGNCAKLIPTNLNHHTLSQSFLCGTPLNDFSAKRLFQETNLLHLMVVSGSHLQIICFLYFCLWPRRLQKSRWAQVSIWILLTAYCLATGFQAPVVRAFIARGFSALSEKFRWNWDAGKVQMAAGLLLLSFFPDWILSFSFYLSWLASSGFLMSPLCLKYENSSRRNGIISHFLSCAFIQSLMSVFFLQTSFLGFLTNALLAPLLALFLFPLSLLAICGWPWVMIAVDKGWDFVIWILQKSLEFFPFSPQSSFQFDPSTPHWLMLWGFLAALHGFFEALRRYRFQRSYV